MLQIDVLDVKQKDISGSKFQEVKADNLEFDNVSLTGTTFNNVNLSKLSLNDVNLSHTKITDANLIGTTIAHSTLAAVHVTGGDEKMAERPCRLSWQCHGSIVGVSIVKCYCHCAGW